jgi:predicted HAD superfamily Cof-like phosphohydrolase
MFDPIVESVKNKYTDRSIRVIEKYNTTLDNNVTDNFLQHLQEELMDATLYIEKELSVKDSKLDMVRQFNKVFEIQTQKSPSLLDKNSSKLKFDLMLEELNEYSEACKNNDIVEISDAVVDMMYILYGIILSHGLSDVIFDMFEEVHKSNMSKLENGKVLRRNDGKIMKGSEYFRPNLKQFL